MSRLSNESLSSLIGDIYDCALNPSGWQDTLARITAALNGGYTTILLSGTASLNVRLAASSPWDSAMLRSMLADYGTEGIPGACRALTGDIDEPISILSELSEDKFQRTGFYRNWAAPQGLRDGCVMKFAHTADRIGFLVSTTRADRDIVSADERRFAALLSPHLRRAALIGDLLDQSRVVLHTYKTALDALAIPVVLAGAAGQIAFANQAAEALFAQRDAPLRARHGSIAANAAWATRALLDSIARSAADTPALGARGIGIPLSRHGEPPCVAYVLPLKKDAAGGALGAAAAVFLSTAASALPPADATLTTLYDLTPAESRVLLRIGAGETPDGAAGALGVSINTVKTHLAHIFSKTETTRQAQLVRLVDALAPPVQMG